MDENINLTSGTSDAVEAVDVENMVDVPETKRTSKLPPWLLRLTAPLDGMGHIWLAFFFSVLVMLLIYIATRAYPFGENSVLVLDLNGQYVYYFEALRDILHGEQGILYSFERALGGEFLGIVAYYLSSPFSLIVALFPEGMITESLFVILLLKCGLSGMNMCVYLHKSHPTKPVNEVIFSVLYALTAYGVVMQHNTMWFDCVLFFPLIMLGIEELIKYGKYKLFTLTLAVAVFSSYYIGYMVCIGVAAYFFFYYLKCTAEERNPLGERAHFIKSLGRIAFFSAVAIGLAAIIILPAYYSLSFGKSTFSNPTYAFKQNFDFLDLIAKMLPASYDTVRPEGLPFVYSGTLTLMLLPVFFLIKEITPRKKIAYGALMLFFIFSFNSSTVDLVWHGMQRPNWLNYRYAFMFCFIIIVMAYKAFEHIERINFRIVLGASAVLGLLVVILQKLDYEYLPDLTCIWVSIGFIAAYVIMLAGCNKRWLEGSVASVLCVFVLLELFVNGLACIVALDDDVHYASRKSYVEFIDKWDGAAEWINENDESFYRAEKTVHRKTNDNFTLNLKGLSNSTSTLNKAQINFLQKMGYCSKSHWSKYIGGTPVSDSLLGLKYIITERDGDISSVYGDPVFCDHDGETEVYRNEYALSLGYMVAHDVADIVFEERESPFERMNAIVTAMLGREEKVELFKPYSDITPTTDNLDVAFVSGHLRYLKTNDAFDAKLTYNFTPVNDYEIFAYFPSEYRRETELSLNGAHIIDFFGNEGYCIVSLGRQTPDEEISVSMKLDSDKVYIADDVSYFYYLDEAVFEEIMPLLAQNQYEISEFTDSHFLGTVNVPADRTSLFLTIPYDEGWKVLVDGEPAETAEVLGALTSVEIIGAGEHTVELTYSPWCVTWGTAITAASAVVFVGAVVVEQAMKRRRRAI